MKCNNVKTKEEIALIRESGKCAAAILEELCARAVPGETLKNLNAHAEKMMLDMGVESAFKGYLGYPYSICTSVNEQVVHGFPTDYVLEKGDILSIDFGVRKSGFCSDTATTLVVGGEASEEIEIFLQLGKNALANAISKARVGNTLKDIGKAIDDTLKGFKFTVPLGISGHGIGRTLHEPPHVFNTEREASRLELVEGVVIAIEPVIFFGESRNYEALPDGWTIVTADRKPACHFEHTIVVTADGPEILTKK